MDPHAASAIIYWPSKQAESEKRFAETLGNMDESFGKTGKTLDDFYVRIDKATTNHYRSLLSWMFIFSFCKSFFSSAFSLP
ncbi:MAG: hypothetical protein ONB46_05650 [candidate division KSB1 bacterium]|nr:hypothetical protein [candidate division KSB1 bacterium]MDZ7365410.1 hypothetical protein [candidate division KSB1 bacterium]MDZ7403543.1 hypothetical protein [candidate division KSB1 bacterium]